MICIKDLINEKDVWYKVGDFYDYDYEGPPVFLMYNIFDINNSGFGVFKSIIMNRGELYKHFMPYSEWLALQREEQIKKVLDD